MAFTFFFRDAETRELAIEQMLPVLHGPDPIDSDGKLKIVGAVYDIEEGQVKWLGENPDQERLLKDAGNVSAHVEGK